MSDGFELNMVCEAPTLTNMLNSSRPKKKNKYEKRRDRSKLKDNSKSTLQPNMISETPSTLSTPLIKDNSGDKSSSKEEEPELSQEVLINSHEKVSQRKESGSMLPVVKISENSTSRKNNLINMEDEEERAKYMAEFHARPMEMDRRAGATSSYTKSQSSSHLFDSHRVLPLHTKLLKVCEDKFNMKQATQIQINTWLKFHEDDQKHNIFVQSETGSGKTLAYLLPIIQVRPM
jgi:DEAD/DEAH box helicase